MRFHDMPQPPEPDDLAALDISIPSDWMTLDELASTCHLTPLTRPFDGDAPRGPQAPVSAPSTVHPTIHQ